MKKMFEIFGLKAKSLSSCVVACSLLLSSSFLASTHTSASELYSSEIPLLYPLKKLDIFIFPGQNALSMIRQCKLNFSSLNASKPDNLEQAGEVNYSYWQPSIRQLEIIEKKVDEYLKDKKLVLPKEKFQRLYFGLRQGFESKKIVLLIYPGGREDINATFGMAEIDCIKVSRKIVFDLSSMRLSEF